MKLYFAPGACSLSPHIVLREAGLNFELEQVDLRTKKTKSGADFLKVNPKGQVPVLVTDDGKMLTEGPAVVQYIADQKPEAKLAPPCGSFDRSRLQEWLNFITSELHKSFSPLFAPNTPEEYKTIIKENLAKRFAGLDAHLAENQYLMGSRFSVADAYAFVVVGWAKPMKIDLAKWRNLTAYLDRIAARPKVQEAMKAEGLA
jgi:glutathione S-transferase